MIQLIQQLSGCENTNKSEVSDCNNSDQKFKMTDASIVKMMSEPAEKNGDADVPGENVPVITYTEGF